MPSHVGFGKRNSSFSIKEVDKLISFFMSVQQSKASKYM